MYAFSGLTGAINDDGPDPAHDDDVTHCLCDSCDPWVRPFDYRESSAKPLAPAADAESEDGDITHCLCDSCDPWVRAFDEEGSFALPFDFTGDTESDGDSEPPALEEAGAADDAWDEEEEDADDVSDEGDSPVSPSFSPSSPVHDLPGPHVLLPCWHYERCTERYNRDEYISVVDDRRGHGAYECVLCCLHWRQRHHAIEHFLGTVHHRRLAFLNGQPMVYCLVCNILPEVASTHLLGDEHRDLLAALCRYGQSSDCTTRRVYTSADGRLRAARVYLPSDVPVDVYFCDRL